MTRFGRSFSVVRVPYAFKLLMQELQAMNVQMRVLTEDNIDQIASMSFSTMTLNLGGAANVIRENKAALGSANAKIPKLPVSPKADNRPALRPAAEAEAEEDPSKRAESLGWEFVNFEANGGEIYQSLIRDDKGVPTQMWSVQQHGGKYPTEHPDGWNAQMLYYNDGVPIKAEAVIDLLKQMPYANNFALAVQQIRDEQALSEANRLSEANISEANRGDIYASALANLNLSPQYEPMSPVSPMSLTQVEEPMVQPPMQMMQPQPPMAIMPQQMVYPSYPMMQPMQPMMQPMQPMMQQPMMQSMQPMMQSMQPMMQMQPMQPMGMASQSPTGANAGQLIKAQLSDTSSATAATSILDPAPEPEKKTDESSSSSSSSSSSNDSSSKRVIKLS
jgi:hypothetical protein